jgi:hypothetical protein
VIRRREDGSGNGKDRFHRAAAVLDAVKLRLQVGALLPRSPRSRRMFAEADTEPVLCQVITRAAQA